jgi:ABC-type cobalt transport system, permease component CbiQ and related transporters
MEQTYIEKLQIHKTNRLAALYPATKFLVVILYTVCTFIIDTFHFTAFGLPLLLMPWFFIVLFLCIASGALSQAMKGFKSIALVALIILLVQTFLVPGGELVAKIWILAIYQKGLRTGVSLSFMVMDVAGVFVWFFKTTENKEIAKALEDSGMNYKAVYVFTSTLRMIEILSKNSRAIMNAQKARGVETEGNILVRSRAFFPSLVPLILGAVISSEERVLTLEARGFSVQGTRTYLFNLEKSGYEGFVTIFSITFTLFLLIGRVVLWIL